MLCQEEMVRVQWGRAPALAGAWDEAKVKAEAAWVVRLRPVRAESVYAPSAGIRPPTSPDSPAFREAVPSAAHQ